MPAPQMRGVSVSVSQSSPSLPPSLSRASLTSAAPTSAVQPAPVPAANGHEASDSVGSESTKVRRDSEHKGQDHKKTSSFEEGLYEIVYDGGVPVNSDVSRNSAQIGNLERGTRVEVLQVADQMEDGRVRGFIESPAGWISLGYGEACCFATLVERAVDRSLSEEAAPQDAKVERDVSAQEILGFFQVAASLAKIQAAASAGAQVQVAAGAGAQVCEHRRDAARKNYFDTLQMTVGWATPRTDYSGCSVAEAGALDAAAGCGRGGAGEGADTAEAERRAARLAKATELRQALDTLRAKDAADRRRRSEEARPTGAATARVSPTVRVSPFRDQKAAAGTERPGEGKPGKPGACRAEAALVTLDESGGETARGENCSEDPLLDEAKRKLASTIQTLREVVHLRPGAKEVAAAD